MIEKVRVPEIVYHVTTRKWLESILNNGLAPATGSSWHTFRYDHRVFVVAREIDLNDIFYLVSRSSDEPDHCFVVLEIDTAKLEEYVEFHKDRNFLGCYWTSEIIPGEALSVNEELTLKMLDNAEWQDEYEFTKYDAYDD